MKKILFLILVLTSCGPAQQKTDTALDVPVAGNSDVSGKHVLVVTSAKDTDLRLTVTGTLTFTDFGQPLETQPCVFVDPVKTFQSFIGVGGALTDASAETFAKLSPEKQEEFLTRYFDPVSGIGYTLARTNIHSCDFSSASYTYVHDGDAALKTFSVAHDKDFRIPFIKKAIAAAGGKLTLFASPWSPPSWMKDNDDMLHGGKLRSDFYGSWAEYFVKFVQDYEREGIPVWAVTVQNEPMATQTWESCIFTAEEERDFVKNYLGPAFAHSGVSGTKIIAWDHNRDLMYQRATTIFSDPEAARYVWGIGFHWYESWTGGGMIFDNVKRVKEAFPDKHLIFTEGTPANFDWSRHNDWSLGEYYGRSMIHDFNNGAEGWTDWNVLLDEQGGPNHVGNFCFAPVHADTQSGEVYYLPAYYYLGHFSKYIRPGAHRIISSSSRGQLLTTAFLNGDGKIAVVVMNQSDQKIEYMLWIAGKAALVTALPHGIQTLVIE